MAQDHPSPQDIVLAYLGKWHGPGSWRTATEEHFAANSVYENMGMSRSVGLEEILAFIDHYETMSQGGWLTAETTAIAAVGNVVLTERVDRMVAGNGTVMMTVPVMGAFEVRDGRIIAWRDYFDTSAMGASYDGPGSLAKAQPAG